MPDFPLIFNDPTSLEGRKHPPVDSTITHLPAISTKASVTQAAGGAGVRHVVSNATFSVAMTGNVAATTVQIAVIDGASGGTTFLWVALLTVAGTTGVIIETPTLHNFGSANTAVTAEFSASISGATESVCLSFHDIGTGAS